MRSGGRVVEGARLESEYTPKAYRGFESLPLRQPTIRYRSRSSDLSYDVESDGAPSSYRLFITNRCRTLKPTTSLVGWMVG